MRRAQQSLRLIYSAAGTWGSAAAAAGSANAATAGAMQLAANAGTAAGLPAWARFLWQQTARGATRYSSSRGASSSARVPPGGAARGSAPPAAGGGASASQPPPARSPFEKWLDGIRSIPLIPRLLGLAGAIPFIALAPPVSKHLFWILPHDVIDESAVFQVGYGISIVTFLGAVHWGLAMGSASMASPLMARAARESYIWSVIPSLSTFWLAGMEPAPASLLLCMMLPACYLVDRSRAHLLPSWYLHLRGPLTLLATFGMLLTATYYIHAEADRVQAAADAAARKKEAAASK